MNPQEQNNNQPEDNTQSGPPLAQQPYPPQPQGSVDPAQSQQFVSPEPVVADSGLPQTGVNSSPTQPSAPGVISPEPQVYGPQQPSPVQPQPQQAGQPNPSMAVGSPLAAGGQATDYYANDTSKSPMLGIISFVLAITVIFAPVGFILGIISIVKAVKAKGNSKSLMIFGVLGTVISTITSWISLTIVIVALFGVMQNALGGGAGDYTKVSQRTFENNSRKITMDVPQKYKMESEFKDSDADGEMKSKVYSNVKIKSEDGKTDFEIDGLKNFNIGNNGGVMLGIADKDNEALKFAPEDIAQLQAAQPEYFTSIKDSIVKSLSSDFSSDCSDKPEVTSEVATPENKSIDISMKISCELKEEKIKATFKFKFIMASSGRTYLIGVIESKTNYDKYSSEIDKIIREAKFE